MVRESDGTTGKARLKVSLRKAVDGDLRSVIDLLKAARLPDIGVIDYLADGYVVAEHDNRVVGAGGVEVFGKFGLLRSVVVKDEFRGTGIGAAIVNDRIAWSRDRGISSLYLLTASTAARSFFEVSGFRLSDRDSFPREVRGSSEFSLKACETATAMELELTAGSDLQNRVRDRYGAIAALVSAGDRCGCSCGSRDENPVTDGLYTEDETSGMPARAVMSSLGCGNPTALATLKEGDIVLDLGSGGGLDALLAARRVGPTGKVIGIDMTNEMLDLAGKNLAEMDVKNVEFVKGSIEDIPLPDESVDIVISNCVINLASDKTAVLKEAYRVLRPGGKFAVSDIVARRSVPADIQSSAAMVLGCMGGNLQEKEYRERLAEAGFSDVEVEPTNIYSSDALYTLGAKGEESTLDGLFMSAFIRATKN